VNVLAETAAKKGHLNPVSENAVFRSQVAGSSVQRRSATLDRGIDEVYYPHHERLAVEA
jgi:hypothetical protein